MRFAKVALRKIRSVAVGDKFCVSEDHEVLTETGWKLISQVTTKEKIATLNSETNELEWQIPSKVYKFQHEGKMYEIKNGLIDLQTTLNHKMYVKSKNSDYDLIKAENIIGKKVWYKRNCINTNDYYESYVLPEIILPWKNSEKVYPEQTYDMLDWLTLFGIYIAEGHIDNARNVRISAHKQRVKDKLNEILPKMNLEFTIYDTEPDYYYLKNHQLSNYLKIFGTANEKHIPDWCKCLSKQESLALLHGLILGDGCYYPKKNAFEYYSNSKQLADDVQILAIMSEMSATITTKAKKGEKIIIKDHETERSNDHYRVYISQTKTCAEPPSDYRDWYENIIENFNDYVYCVEVPNHIFMIRRNNKYCWTGNSSRAGKSCPCSMETYC
jgi:UDP-glucuronate decarboxylase